MFVGLPRVSGAFSHRLLTPLLGMMTASKPNHRICTWNGRAILHKDSEKRSAKLHMLASLLGKYDTVAVQELHGDAGALEAIAQRFEATHWCAFSPGASWSHGGVMTFHKKNSFRSDVALVSTEVVAGRALLTFLELQDGARCGFLNVHNHGLHEEQLDAIQGICQPLFLEAVRRPACLSLMVLGDLNHIGEDTASFSMSACSSADAAPSQIHCAGFWQDALADGIDLRFPAYTHFNPGTDKLNILSKAVWFTAPWLMLHLHVACDAEDPITFYAKGLSDHAPAWLEISCAKIDNKQRRQLPTRVCQSLPFKSHLLALCEATDFESMDPFLAVELMKDFFAEAGRVATDRLRAVDSQNPESRVQLLSSIARAVARQDSVLALKLIDRNHVAASLLTASATHVSLCNPQAFSELFSEAKRDLLEERLNHNIESSNSTNNKSLKHQRQLRSQRAALHRHAALWKTSHKYVSLQGILLPNKTVAKSSKDKLDALSAYWGPIFQEKLCDSRLVKEFCEKYVTKWSVAAPPPSSRTLMHVAMKARDSKPGRDGVPYAAWASAGAFGSNILFRVLGRLSIGVRPPLPFNHTGNAFIPKGEQHEDAMEIIREPNDVRPLGLRNTDNKIVTGGANYKMRAVLTACACWLQRGFVITRQMIENVIDLDAAGRIFAFSNPEAILALFDLCAAFPSVAHMWLFTVLEHLGFYQGFIDLVQGVYFLVMSFSLEKGVAVFMYMIFSGVLQGDPLSGLLFAVAFEPFVRAFQRLQHRRSIEVRCCADDVGAVMSDLQPLKDLRWIFVYAADLAGLEINALKCVIVPLGKPCSPDVVAWIRHWLKMHVPEWSSCKIQSSGKYLGFQLGPLAEATQFDAVAAKWLSRARQIAAAGSSALVTTHAYNMYAFSVLAYKMQLLFLPDSLLKLESHVIDSCLKIPSWAYGAGGPHYLQHAGLKDFHSMIVTNLAALTRTANITCQAWKRWAPLIREAAGATMSLEELAMKKLKLAWWDNDPIALRLELFDKNSGHAWKLTERASSAVCVDHPPLWPPFVPSLPKLLQKAICTVAFPREELNLALDEKKAQREVGKLLKPLLLPNDLIAVIHRRAHLFLRRHFPDALQLEGWKNLSIDTVLTAWRRLLSPFQASLVLRTACNAWISTHRMSKKEGPCDCIFLCGVPGGCDRLAHYLQCPIVDILMRKGLAAPQSNVLAKLCLTDCQQLLETQACLVFVYHFLRKWKFPADLVHSGAQVTADVMTTAWSNAVHAYEVKASRKIAFDKVLAAASLRAVFEARPVAVVFSGEVASQADDGIGSSPTPSPDSADFAGDDDLGSSVSLDFGHDFGLPWHELSELLDSLIV